MDRLNQLVDQFNNLTFGRRLVVIAIAGGVLIVVLLFILILASSKPAPKKTLPPIPVFHPSASPQVAPVFPTPGATQTPTVSQLQGISVTFPSLKDNFIYYLSDGGTTFYKVSLDGKIKQQLSDTLVTQIKQVIWSNDKSSAILKIENNKYFLGKNNSPFLSQEDDNLVLTNWYYNFTDKSFKKLDSKIGPIAYIPDSSKIVYIKESAGDELNKLYIANSDGSNEQLITTLPEIIQDNLSFLDKDNILTFATPHGYGRNFIYLTNLTTKQTQKLTEDGFTFGANPSPKGDAVLAQTVKEDPEVFYKNFLSAINMQNRQMTVLEIQTTPDLAAFSPDGNTIYAFEQSKLWVIDSTSLSKNFLNLPAEFSRLKVDSDSVMVSPDNSTIFFTSDGRLYNLQIK